jgi:CubicO group peptidase (beta-lactamase class C family)
MQKNFLIAVSACLYAGVCAAAPDEEALGKSKGYPRGSRSTYWEESYRVGSFSSLDEIFPYCTVQPSASPLVLKKAAAEPEIKYRFDGKTLSIDDYLNRQRTTGLIVLKDGEIVVERYQYDRKSDQRMVSHSMAKTIVSLALGVALGEAKIASLDDTAAKYAPAIAGSAYGDTALKHLLRMSSGVKFVEDYSGMDDLARWTEAVRTQGTPRAVKLFNRRDREPGTQFQYAGSQTVVLTLAVRGATGRTLCEWVTEKLWQPMGAESKATWLVAQDGVELAQGNFNATLRDFARLGWLLANDGKLGDKQIVPKEYLLQATRAACQPEAFRPGVMDYKGSKYFGYGYQTWIFPGSKPRFALLGIFGQAIFIDPELKLVMVHTAVAKKPSDPDMGRERDALWRGVVAHFGSWQ